jgi:hypothetical protein
MANLNIMEGPAGDSALLALSYIVYVPGGGNPAVEAELSYLLIVHGAIIRKWTFLKD